MHPSEPYNVQVQDWGDYVPYSHKHNVRCISVILPYSDFASCQNQTILRGKGIELAAYLEFVLCKAEKFDV